MKTKIVLRNTLSKAIIYQDNLKILWKILYIKESNSLKHDVQYMHYKVA